MAHKAVFLDRDDTLIDDPGYIQRPEQVRLLPGAAEALMMLKEMGYLLVVVTNQSGVARGLITEKELNQIHKQLRSLLAAEGAEIDGIYYCPYHPEGAVKNFSMESNLRKPNAGMLFQAEEEMDIDLKQSWMIGDSYRDIWAGQAAGCHTILVDVPGKLRTKAKDDPEPYRKAVNLREAVNIIRMYEFHQRAMSAKKTATQPEESFDEPENENPDATETTEEPKVDETVNSEPDDTPESTVETPPEETKEPSEEQPEPDIEQAEAAPDNEPDIESQPISTETTADEPVQQPSSAEPAANSPTNTETHQLLEQVLHRLKGREREDLYQEFSIFKLLSLMLQVVAVFCLIVSLGFWLSPNVSTGPVLVMISYAIALQVLVITLLIMHSKE